MANTPAPIKDGPGTKCIVVLAEFHLFPRSLYSVDDQELWSFGDFGSNTLISSKYNGAGHETQTYAKSGGVTLVSSEQFPGYNQRMMHFHYINPSTAIDYTYRNGKPAGEITGDAMAGGTIASMNALEGTNGVNFCCGRLSGGVATYGAGTRLSLWYVPQGTHTLAQINQMAEDFYLTGSSSLLPEQLTYADGNYHVGTWEPDDTDFVDGKVRNRVVHSGAGANWNKLIAAGGTFIPTMAVHEGYEFTCMKTGDASGSRYGFVRTATNDSFFAEHDGTYGTITEFWVCPDVMPGAGSNVKIAGDTNNYVQLTNTAGTYSIGWFLNNALRASSNASFPPAQDIWLHVMLIDTGAATNNLYVATHGYLGTVATYDVSAPQANAYYCFGKNANTTTTPDTSVFMGNFVFARRFRILEASFPSAANLARIAQYHAEQMQPGNNPGAIHPVLEELLSKTVNAVVQAESVAWVPGNIRKVTTTDYRWDAQVTNTAFAASTMQGTFVKESGGGSTLEQYIAQDCAILRRVIHVGAPSGTNPTALKGVPAISGGAAAGPYVTASAFADAAAVVKAGDILRITATDHSAAVNTLAVAGQLSMKTSVEGTLTPIYGSNTKIALVINAADMHVKGFEVVNSAGIGLSVGAAALRWSAKQLVAHNSLLANIGVNVAAVNGVLSDYISKDGTTYGVDSAVAFESRNGIVLGNTLGSINAPASTLKNNNLDVAASGGADSSVNADHNIVAHTPKFKDVDAANQNLSHTMQSNTVHSGEGGKDQGPFKYKYRGIYDEFSGFVTVRG